MRTMSTSAVQALMAQETDAVFLILLTIEHESLAVPIRVVNNNVNIVSRGNTYQAFAFDITLPNDDDGLPVAKLTMDNIGLELIKTIRSIKSNPTVTIEIILASSPDTVELAVYDMTLKSVQFNAYTVSGDLVVEDILNQPLHGSMIDSSQYRGLL